MLSDSLLESFRSRIESLGFDLADLRVGGTPNRPLVQVRIDRGDPAGAGEELAGSPDAQDRRVTVDECATVSRALESWLDRDGPLGSRYVLEVSSPGMDRPLRWHRHWVRFVGRDVHARLPGLGRVRARIVAVPDEETVLLEPLPGSGKREAGNAVGEGSGPLTVKIVDIRDARLAVDW